MKTKYNHLYIWAVFLLFIVFLSAYYSANPHVSDDVYLLVFQNQSALSRLGYSFPDMVALSLFLFFHFTLLYHMLGMVEAIYSFLPFIAHRNPNLSRYRFLLEFRAILKVFAVLVVSAGVVVVFEVAGFVDTSLHNHIVDICGYLLKIVLLQYAICQGYSILKVTQSKVGEYLPALILVAVLLSDVFFATSWITISPGNHASLLVYVLLNAGLFLVLSLNIKKGDFL